MHNWLTFNFVISNFILHILVCRRISVFWKEDMFKYIYKVFSVHILRAVA